MATTKVVILNWNGQLHLQTFLPSVVRHTPVDVGIVVADNGSTDSSIAFLNREYPQIEVIELDNNYGFAEGYNRALAKIDADYFILLNSDVECTMGWCEPLIECLESDSAICAVAPKLLSYAENNKFEYAGAAGGYIDLLGYPFCRGRILSTIETDNGQYDDRTQIFWASGACFAVRAEAFENVGGFDGSFFAHMEEIDLCWRMQLKGGKIFVEPRSKVYHLGGGTLPNNNPRKLYLNFRNNLWMLYKNLPSNKLVSTLIIRMILDGGSAAVYLLQGRLSFFKAVWNAHMDFRRNLPALRQKRRNNFDHNKILLPNTIFSVSILINYFLGKRFFHKIM